MNRRNFLERVAVTGGVFTSSSLLSGFTIPEEHPGKPVQINTATGQMKADVVIIGGGIGGCATAFAALRNNLTVVMTEETDWIGGQLTQQVVPLDENRWIETQGAPQLYREFRKALRNYYRDNYPLTDEARANPLLNPGNGFVSPLCIEPVVAVKVLENMFAPYVSSARLVILRNHKAIGAEVAGDVVNAISVKNLCTKDTVLLTAPYFVDATELGDLLPMTGTEYVTGTESKEQTNELHAPIKGNPKNNQAFTVCYVVDYAPGEDHTIKKPEEWDFWKDYVPQMKPAWSGKMIGLSYSDPRTLQPRDLGFHPEGISTGNTLNMWNYRRIIHKNNFREGFYKGDMTIINWPQNDYLLGDIIDVDEATFNKHVNRAKQQSLSLLYWLQTEAPRPDGGKGWKGVRLRKDVVGTEDGMAKYPYIREARRIKALFTILEEHVGTDNRAQVTGMSVDEVKAAEFYDSVGTGYYHIDLHPSSGGDNYIDFASLRYQIPLGALLPVRMKNLLPTNKNIGTTHITNGCYREHPVEWSIGEAVGMLIWYSLQKNVIPRDVRQNSTMLRDFQQIIRSQGLQTEWKDD